MTAALPVLLQGLLAMIGAAPQIVDLVNKAKDLIAALFSAKLITKEQQDALFLSIDAHCALVNSGFIGIEFKVEKDPLA